MLTATEYAALKADLAAAAMARIKLQKTLAAVRAARGAK